MHCVRNAPDLNRKTGEARWPRIRPTDICGAFRHCDGCPLESDSWPRHDLPVYTDAYGDYCKIPLTKSQFAKVDPEDYIWLSQFRWHCKVNKNAVYAVRTVKEGSGWKRIFLHRLLMDTPEGKVCDHLNHDGLDDRKDNLRNCTIAENNANRRRLADGSSQYIGVSWDKRRKIWTAHIKMNGEDKYLGSFEVEEAAARAYDAAAWAHHGVFANLNFPENYPDHPMHRMAGSNKRQVTGDKTTRKGGPRDGARRGERSFAQDLASIRSIGYGRQKAEAAVGRASPLAEEPNSRAKTPRSQRRATTTKIAKTSKGNKRRAKASLTPDL